MLKNEKILRVLGILALSAVFLTGAAVDAQEKEKKPAKAEKKKGKKSKKKSKKKSAKAEKGKAKELHGQAVSLYKDGNYEEALKFFELADEISPNPVTLFNMGRCYEKLGKYKEAYDYYQDYIDSGDDARFEDAQEAVEKIEAMPVKLKIHVYPGGSEIFIDGEPVEAKKMPVELEITPGQHTLFIRKYGYENVEEGLEIPPGEEVAYETELVKSTVLKDNGKKKSKRRGEIKVPISLHFAAGATVSTSDIVTSYIGANLGIAYRIKDFAVGIGLDNMFFTDSYLLAAFPAGSYNLKVWKNLSINFTVGFGGACLYSTQEVVDSEGNIIITSGNMWDLVAHADAKLRYKVGPIMIQAIPLNVDVFVGAGSIEPAPLAQFAFLFGIAYDF